MESETPQLPPRCFGKKWDSSDKVCSGGMDPDYFDPETKTHVRPKCEFFGNCMNKMRLRQQEEVRSRSLPVLSTPPQTFRPQAAAPQPQPRQELTAQQMVQQLAQLQSTQTHPTEGRVHPVMWPAEAVIPVNYKMPNYLTVLEERDVGESPWSVLGREILRSLGKAFGHTIAAFFDRTRLKDKRNDGQ